MESVFPSRSDMPKGSEELTNARKEEIIDACALLYEKKSFREITIKDIGNVTSFTRTSIYNYFETKEEIFLALLQREYQKWIDDMRHMRQHISSMTSSEFAEEFSHLLEKRSDLLKLLSMNHYDMEENSRMERLTEFKCTYGESLNEVENCLKQYFPQMDEKKRKEFLFSFFPFMFGIYPYAVVTEKQKVAMNAADVNYIYMSVFDLIHMQVTRLLNNA